MVSPSLRVRSWLLSMSCLVLVWLGLLPGEAWAIPTTTYSVADVNGAVVEGSVFDFARMTLRDFPPLQVTEGVYDQMLEIAPNVNLEHLVPGNTVASPDYLTVGLLDSAFGFGEFSIAEIAHLTQTNLATLPLSAFGEAISHLQLGELVESIDAFATTPIRDSTFLSSLVSEEFASMGEFLAFNPDLAAFPLAEMGADLLGQFSVADVPGLSETPLGALESIQAAFIGDFEALGLLDTLPLSGFPSPPVLNDIIRMGRLDVPLGEAEHDRLRVVSGGVTDGDAFNGEPCAGGGCTHVELDEVGRPPSAGLSGFAWMTSDQQVPDGYGILCIPFGCQGPAGNHPFGKAFRVLFNHLNEADGSVQVAISFRYCKRFWFVKSCTPYVFPTPQGIPIGTLYEKALFPVTPPDIALSGQDFNYGNYGGGASGGSYRNPCLSGGRVSGDIVDRAVEALTTVPLYDRNGRPVGNGWDPAGVQERASVLIGAALEQGMTDPAHIAYMLATVGHESLFRGPIEEFESGWRQHTGPGDYGAIHPETGQRYYGRGDVQVTWAENYQKIDRILGTDTYHNPDQMLDPTVSAQATVIGMRDGIYTGQRLDDYGQGDNFDWRGARSIINDGDLRSTIGGYGQYIYDAIKDTDPNAIENREGSTNPACAPGDGTVASPLGGGSLNDLLNTYQLANFQRFDAYRAYRNGWHGGIDLDYRANGGAGGAVNSVSQGTVVSVKKIGEARLTGEPSVQVVVMTTDSQGRQIEQRYNHLSLSSVQAATGCGLGACNAPVASGTQLGAVGAEDTLSRGAHLDYKVKIDGQHVDPWGFLQVQASTGSGAIHTIDLNTGAIGSIEVVPLGTPEPQTPASPPLL